MSPPSPEPGLADMLGTRVIETADTHLPIVALLGRAPFTTMVTAAGGGISRHGSVAINRWRMDPTRDDYGQWCYLRDGRTGRIWSAAHQPTGVAADSYRVTMALHGVTFERRDGDILTTTEVVAVPGSLAESRRVTVFNSSGHDTEIELTSYQEIVLATTVSDRGHRAFGNLFVQTEWLRAYSSLLAMRRPRSAKDSPVWCGHTIASSSSTESSSCETDRARFQGRGRGPRNPVAMDTPGDLTNTVGAVLDPVLSFRVALAVPAGDSASVIFTTFSAADRADAIQLAEFFSNVERAGRGFGDAIVDAEAELVTLGVTPHQAGSDQAHASELIYGGRPRLNVNASRGDLLAVGLTGEFPVFVSDPEEDDETITASLRIHGYWRAKGVISDLVFACRSADRARETGAIVAGHLASIGETAMLGKPGGVFVFPPGALGKDTWRLLGSIARARIGGPSARTDR